jgi:hypothetical protein
MMHSESEDWTDEEIEALQAHEAAQKRNRLATEGISPDDPVLGVLKGQYPARTMPISARKSRIVPTDEQANQIVEELSREQEDTGSA